MWQRSVCWKADRRAVMSLVDFVWLATELLMNLHPYLVKVHAVSVSIY